MQHQLVMTKQKRKAVFKRICRNCRRIFETSSFKGHYCSKECRETYLKKERERLRKKREKRKDMFKSGEIWILDEETWTWTKENR